MTSTESPPPLETICQIMEQAQAQTQNQAEPQTSTSTSASSSASPQLQAQAPANPNNNTGTNPPSTTSSIPSTNPNTATSSSFNHHVVFSYPVSVPSYSYPVSVPTTDTPSTSTPTSTSISTATSTSTSTSTLATPASPSTSTSHDSIASSLLQLSHRQPTSLRNLYRHLVRDPSPRVIIRSTRIPTPHVPSPSPPRLVCNRPTPQQVNTPVAYPYPCRYNITQAQTRQHQQAQQRRLIRRFNKRNTSRGIPSQPSVNHQEGHRVSTQFPELIIPSVLISQVISLDPSYRLWGQLLVNAQKLIRKMLRIMETSTRGHIKHIAVWMQQTYTWQITQWNTMLNRIRMECDRALIQQLQPRLREELPAPREPLLQHIMLGQWGMEDDTHDEKHEKQDPK